MTTEPTLRIQLMGSPTILHNGETITLERRKALALVAYLAVNRKPTGRDYLATLLWAEYDETRARASLRRTLTVINKTPLNQWVQADRHTISLSFDDDIFVDVAAFEALIDVDLSPANASKAINLYQDGFMVGFSLRDSASFDNWQSLQAQTYQQRLMMRLEDTIRQMIDKNQSEDAIALIRHWLTLDPLDETAHYLLIEAYGRTGQRNAALQHYENYHQLLEDELGVEPSEHVIALYDRIREDKLTTEIAIPTTTVLGNLPVVPALVIGRDAELETLKARIGLSDAATNPTIIQGWPGIGKTTITSLLAHETDVHNHFTDGVLWTSLGESPNILGELMTWGKALNIDGFETIKTVEDAQTRLTAHLRDKKMLIIVDDAWQTSHALPFRVGGQNCVTLFTTRMNDVAQQLASEPGQIYKIPILSEEAGLDLLKRLAPQVVETKPQESRELISDLEGLPLAIQVAGRLLHNEMSMGWDIGNLLQEMREEATLLEALAPADRTDLANETSPTVAALLKRSTDLLDDESRERFALLGVFAPKPATFDQSAMKAVWMADDVRPSIRKLVDRGLLEPVGNGRFQMHALLVKLAKSMFATP
jgi:DNA-binding SARP family transcriptional activator